MDSLPNIDSKKTIPEALLGGVIFSLLSIIAAILIVADELEKWLTRKFYRYRKESRRRRKQRKRKTRRDTT